MRPLRDTARRLAGESRRTVARAARIFFKSHIFTDLRSNTITKYIAETTAPIVTAGHRLVASGREHGAIHRAKHKTRRSRHYRTTTVLLGVRLKHGDGMYRIAKIPQSERRVLAGGDDELIGHVGVAEC